MSEGTGSSFLDDIIDVGANIASVGLVGFNDKGFRAGVTGRAGLDAAKEITGAAAAEQANELARQQFENDKARLEQQRVDSIKENERRQVTASRSAGRARGNTSAAAANLSGASNQTDILGL